MKRKSEIPTEGEQAVRQERLEGHPRKALVQTGRPLLIPFLPRLRK